MRRSAIVLIVLATLIAFVSVFAVWAKRQLLETSTYTETSTQLLQNEDIQNALAPFLVDQLYANVDVQAELEKQLPPQTRALAGPAAGALRELANRAALEALQRPAVQTLWEQANERAHGALIHVIEGGGPVVSTTGDDVTLDLGTLVDQIGSQVGIDVSSKLPPDAGQIDVLKSDELGTVQDAVNLLRKLAVILPLLALGLYALAIYLDRGRRRKTVRTVGWCFIGIGITVLAARSFAGKHIVDSLTATASTVDAAQAAWNILTSLLAGIGDAMIFYGVVAVLGAWLAGPTAVASSIRRDLTPGLRERQVGYAVLALLLILLFLWDPTQGTSRVGPSIVLIVLAVAGLEGLRLQALRDFPDVTFDDVSERWRTRFANLRPKGRATAAGEARVDELERLAQLRDTGVLTPDEFEREKQRVLTTA
jgi:hypothetical protein